MKCNLGTAAKNLSIGIFEIAISTHPQKDCNFFKKAIDSYEDKLPMLIF